MEPDIRNVNGHYKAYYNGRFICSGDTRNEAETEAMKCLVERENNYA